METDVSTLAKQTFGILVVDDERTLRFTLKEGLSEEGYRVETAADCAEALEKLERDEFHLALLDQKLPDGRPSRRRRRAATSTWPSRSSWTT